MPTDDKTSLFLVQVGPLCKPFFCINRTETRSPSDRLSVPPVFQMATGSRPVRISKRGLSFITSRKKFFFFWGGATLEAALQALIWGWTCKGEVRGSQLHVMQGPVVSQLWSASGFILISRLSPLVAFSSLYLVKYLILQPFED